MWIDLILSTLAFMGAAWWLRRYFDDQGFPPGLTRNVMVMVIATAASFAVSALVSWVDGEPAAEQQLMQQAGQPLSQLPLGH